VIAPPESLAPRVDERATDARIVAPRTAPVRYDNVNLLRAFAALAVVIYHVIEHSGWKTFPTEGPLVTFRIGWIGVDLFFVISGFVITYSALTLRAGDPQAFARRYWARRLTRILPLYFLTIAIWIAAMVPGFFAGPVRAWAWQLFTHATFTHSFFTDTHSALDGVNWTLAIEMQFYLAISLLAGWISRTPAWRIALYAVAVSWAWRAAMFVLFGHADTWVLFMRVTQLPGTLDEFAAGIVLAKLVLARPRAAHAEAFAWLAAAAALGYASMALYWPRAMYWTEPGMVIFWRTAFASFLLCVLAAAVRLPQVLGSPWLRPLDHLGEISYGIYLWHLFAIEYVIHARGMRQLEAMAWVLCLTLLAASVSWRCFERPFMALARRPPPSRTPRSRVA
jgi:peptidoglycan/LPS O-acetylase OafA/YrhL